jgi:type IV pilus assembly protein PilV
MFCDQAAEAIRQKSDSRGFTLMEVLMAMAIFSIGILAVGTMQINSANSNTGARIHTEEYTWVAGQIERLTALDYDHGDLSDDVNVTHSVDRGPYTVSWTVVNDSPVEGAKRITVTATGSHARARPITIDFIKAR